MERLGGAIMFVYAQAQNVRSESPPPSKTFVGWSAALPPDCIGRLIGARRHNIQRLQRQLELINLTVVKEINNFYILNRCKFRSCCNKGKYRSSNSIQLILSSGKLEFDVL